MFLKLKECLPFYKKYLKFSSTRQNGNYFDYLKFVLRLNKHTFPRDSNCLIANESGISIGINCLIGRPGNYLQGAGKIYFGDYVQLAPNVGILSSNHDLYDQRKYVEKQVVIGDYSWIGMNSVVLAGVVLGPRTIVAAGSVVTKSFEDGFCVIGGVPAKVIKLLDKNEFHPWEDVNQFYGYIERSDYEDKSQNEILERAIIFSKWRK